MTPEHQDGIVATALPSKNPATVGISQAVTKITIAQKVTGFTSFKFD